jgi:Na+/proline symporter
MKVSHALTALWGVVQIGAALYAIGRDRRIVDTVLSIASFTNGPILGLFFLGTLTRRVRQSGALVGVIAGVATMIYVWARVNVSWQWYVLIGSAVTFAVGFATSLLFERAPEVIEQTGG